MSSRALALLPVLMMLVLPAGCGESSETTGSTTSRTWELVEILDATAAGGTVDTRPVPVTTAAQQRALTRDLTRPQLARQLAEVVAAHETAPGRELVGAIVAVGCTPPAEVDYDGEQVRVPPSGARVQCLAPITSLAVLEVPAE